MSRSGAVLFPVTLLAGCLSAPPAPRDAPAGLDLYMPVPAGAALSTGAVQLGRALYFDPILSRDSSLACGSCHDPAHGFANAREVSVGIDGRRGTRNVPTLINRGYGEFFFWDGRIRLLERQVLQPIVAPQEMDATVEAILTRLSSHDEYADRFRATFGRPPDSLSLAQALAAYIRSIRSGDSPFDRRGEGDSSALDPEEIRGLRLFQGRAGCVRCHLGANFTDERFHNTGVAWRGGTLADSGRFAVTGDPADLGAFKTPTLREVARTAPYMHDGSLATLEAVLEFYSEGGIANPHQDPLMRPRRLAAGEQAAIVAFLRSLSGRVREGADRH